MIVKGIILFIVCFLFGWTLASLKVTISGPSKISESGEYQYDCIHLGPNRIDTAHLYFEGGEYNAYITAVGKDYVKIRVNFEEVDSEEDLMILTIRLNDGSYITKRIYIK